MPGSDDDSDVPPKARRGTRSDFMKYPRPKTEQILARLEELPGVKEESKRCIANLLHYRAVRPRARLPRGPSAAVLVPLFVGRSGDLYVVLSRRSDALKDFAGDTALPGGKVDPQDVTVEDTARREAFEEIGMPQDKERVPLLCVMEPHLAKGEILVTPVVVLILDNGLQPNLNSSEVTSIFAQPLISFLSSTPHLPGGRAADPNDPYHTFTDFSWSDTGTVRLHRFLTGREAEGVKPVFGLTAAILIKTATIGFGRTPDFEVQPPNAPTPVQQIVRALLTPTNPLNVACQQEGIDANKTASRLLRPHRMGNAARATEWGKIGKAWKWLLDSGDGVASGDREPGDHGAQIHVGEVEERVQGQVSSEGGEFAERLDLEIEKHESPRDARAGENGEESRDAIPRMAQLGEFLDEAREMLDERMKEVSGDETKLAQARKVYPKIAKQVKKQFQGAGDGAYEGGVKSGNEGLERGGRGVDYEEKRDQGVQSGRGGVRRGLKEMRRRVGQGGDGHDPEPALCRKRDAKL